MELTAILDLAERQHSMVNRDQLAAAGLTRQAISRLRLGPDWEALTPRVLVRRGARASPEAHLMAAALDAGLPCFVSSIAAAALWGVSGFSVPPPGSVDVTRWRFTRRRPSSLAVLHHVVDIEPGHSTMLHGIPARTAFELAAALHPQRAERAVDNLLTRNLTSLRLLHDMLEDWADCGRGGTVVMRDILERRPPGYVPPASNLEARFDTLSERHGIGPFRRQVDVGGEHWIGRVDFGHVHLPLLVEVLSERYHAALLDQAADARRFRMLEAAGFRVEAVWDHELWGNPLPAINRLRAAEIGLRRAA